MKPTNNTPYVKKYENGILVNPITKENPYLFASTKNFRGSNYSSFRIWITERNKFFVGKVISILK